MTAETITVKDLAERIGKPAGEIIKKLLMSGHHGHHQPASWISIRRSLICSEFGVEPGTEAG